MPKVNPSATKATSKVRTVQYMNVDGRTMNATVEGGSGATLNLWVPHLPKANQHKTGIAKRTTVAQTNVWW